MADQKEKVSDDTLISQPSSADNSSKHPKNASKSSKAEVTEQIEEEKSTDDTVFIQDKPGEAFSATLRSNPSSSGSNSDTTMGNFSLQDCSDSMCTYASVGSSASTSSLDPPQQQEAVNSSQQNISSQSNIPDGPSKQVSNRRGKRGSLYKFQGNVPLEIEDFMKRANGIYICQICDFRTVNCDRKKEHMTKHTNVNYFICTSCSESFPTLYRLRCHIRETHTGH